MAASKKSNGSIEDTLVEKMGDDLDKRQLYNPLLMALKENDKKHLFQTNVTTVFHKTGFHLFDYYFGAVINIHDDLGKLIGQESRVGQAAGTFNLLIGNSQSGKSLPNSTKIPTPTGWTRMGDLQVGDYVFDKRGRRTKVLGVFPQGTLDVYRLHLENGRYSDCSLEHLWTVHKNHNSESMTLPLYEIIKNLKNERGCYNYSIEAFTGCVEYVSDINLKGFSESDKFATYLRFHKTSFGDSETIEPFVCPSIMFGPIEWRLDLLRKAADKSLYNTCISLCNQKYNIIDDYTIDSSLDFSLLYDDIEYIIRGLGYDIDPKSLTVEMVDKIYADLKPHLKSGIMFEDLVGSKSNNNQYLVDITKIEKIGREECTCIYVESPDHLFLTDQFIITHNTTLAAQIAANIIRQYKYANAIHFDCENRFDVSRCETITQLPASYFNKEYGERYMIRTGHCGLDVIQEMVVKTYVNKMKLKHELTYDTGFKDEFGNEVHALEPTVIIIDSITTVLNETFNPESAKEASEAEKMRSNTEGARDAKTLKGFFKDVIPLCKEANIIIYGINHINQNMSMNAFLPVAKQQNYLKQDEIIPGGKTMIYYPFNIIKLTAKPSDDFTEEGDGFVGHMVMVEPIKSSSNQSGNNSKGLSFEMVFTQKYGFDPLRTMIMYGRHYGMIEGNRARLKFKDDDSFNFSMKSLYHDKDTKPIWENINKYIVPQLKTHLSYIEPQEHEFDTRGLDY